MMDLEIVSVLLILKGKELGYFLKYQKENYMSAENG
jgi:hypothetical protein